MLDSYELYAQNNLASDYKYPYHKTIIFYRNKDLVKLIYYDYLSYNKFCFISIISNDEYDELKWLKTHFYATEFYLQV